MIHEHQLREDTLIWKVHLRTHQLYRLPRLKHLASVCVCSSRQNWLSEFVVEWILLLFLTLKGTHLCQPPSSFSPQERLHANCPLTPCLLFLVILPKVVLLSSSVFCHLRNPNAHDRCLHPHTSRPSLLKPIGYFLFDCLFH